MLKKLKKGLKKAAKFAIPVGAALLAAKGMRNKKLLGETEDGKGGIDTTRRALQAMTSNDAYNDDTMPGNLSRNMGQKRKQFMPGVVDYMSKGGRAGKKSKPKSIGKALRGGGKVMR
jgi:hypothetical protein